MKIPKSVSVMGLKYKVKMVTQQQIDKIYQGAAGVCSPHDESIYILKTLPEKLKKRVYLHELAHAFLERIGADQTLNANENEMMAQCMSSFLSELL